MKKTIVMAAAILCGLAAFLLGVVKYPEVLAVLDRNPDASLLACFVLVEILAFTVFVACTSAFWVAGQLRLPGFHPEEARAWRVTATVPLLFIGPIAVVWLASQKAYLDAFIHGVVLTGAGWNLVLLNRKQKGASSQAAQVTARKCGEPDR
jgi:hypothetical protein